MKQKLLLLGALVFGLLAAILSYQQIQEEKRRIAGDSETVYVISLRNSKVAGDELQEADMERKEIKRIKNQESVHREIPWSQQPYIVGRKVEVGIPAGQTLLTTDLKPATQESGFNRNIRPQGMRAVGIPVSTVNSVNNLIKPGDYVDIIGTFRFPDMRGDTTLDTVTMTILQNVRVLATGSRWDTFSMPIDGAGRAYGSVVVLLAPDEVEMVLFASQKGTLALSLRHYDDAKILRDIEKRSVNFKQLEKFIPLFNERRERQRER